MRLNIVKNTITNLHNNISRNKKMCLVTAFPLVELVIVIAIIGILATIATSYSSSAISQAKDASLKNKASSILSYLEQSRVLNKEAAVLGKAKNSDWELESTNNKEDLVVNRKPDGEYDFKKSPKLEAYKSVGINSIEDGDKLFDVEYNKVTGKITVKVRKEETASTKTTEDEANTTPEIKEINKNIDEVNSDSNSLKNVKVTTFDSIDYSVSFGNSLSIKARQILSKLTKKYRGVLYNGEAQPIMYVPKSDWDNFNNDFKSELQKQKQELETDKNELQDKLNALKS